MKQQNIFIFCLGYSLGAAMSMEKLGRNEEFLFAAIRQKIFVDFALSAAK
jgi:hypothetical protein